MADDSQNTPSFPPPIGDDDGSAKPPGFRERARKLVEDVSEKTRTLFVREHTDSMATTRTSRTAILKQKLQRQVQGFDPSMTLDWAGKALQKHGTAFWGKIITIVVSAFFFADLGALFLSRFIPEPPPSRPARFAGGPRRGATLDDYGAIFSRNLFNSKGIIPGEELPSGPADLGAPPVRTTLPFNLIGTMILKDELRSLATIEDKSANLVYPVRVDDEIPSKARILKIEARRVVFVNTASGRREFVELPEDLAGPGARVALGGPRVSIGVGGPAGAGVEQVSPTAFSVSRSEVDRALSDLNNILTQARAVPNFENGLPAGYKLFQIVPGSIYDKLGLKNGDVIAGIDGQTINDPGKAFEALSRLKETNHLDLMIKRDGRQQTYSYDIR